MLTPFAMASATESPAAEISSGLSPVPTLKAPGDKMVNRVKAKAAEERAIKDVFLAKEIFLLADLSSTDKGKQGIPLSLLYSVLRLLSQIGKHGLD